MSEQLGRDRHKPAGEWVQTTTVVPVAGIQFRRSDVGAFITAVRKAESSGRRYGVRLEHHPYNRHDSNAIAVYGYAEISGWFRAGMKEWHIGFLDRHTAKEIVRDLISPGVPIAGELYKIYVGDDGFVDVKVLVLAPPNYGLKSRLRGR